MSINRSRTWYSFCISWAISSFVYCLLFFSGEQFNLDENPSYGTCLVQAALSYSSPPLTGATTLALLWDVWWTFRTATMGKRASGKTAMLSLLIVPYASWIVLTIGFLVVGGVNPQLVLRDLTIAPFCYLNHPFPPIFVCIITLALALAVLVLLIRLAINMRRIRKQIRQSHVRPSRNLILPHDTGDTKGKGNSSHGRNKQQLSALSIRLAVFSLGGLIALTISVVFVINREAGVWTDLAIATLPVLGFFIFGSQKDFLQLWLKLILWPFPCLRRNARTSSNNSNEELELAKYSRSVEASDVGFAPHILDNDEIDGSSSISLIHLRDEEEVLVSPRKGVTF
ncbi:hypothetical protein BDP27DRAFT_1321357 [Rhodocollybia butyracea]|uniref:Uncharacterized protein n=1 Tax=Rhodocollybia butyracea TaxID=206335 RepID=A0A9P5UA82_9AGAR|nr:hypothetical protein BDP27DRAFT_1321357 [Rhodocollybia butyracea]